MYCTEIKKNKSSYEIIEVNYEKVNDEDLIHTMMTIVNILYTGNLGFLGGTSDNSPVSAGDRRDVGSIPGSRRFPWRRASQPTPVFLPRASQGQSVWQATIHRFAKSRTQLKQLAGVHGQQIVEERLSHCFGNCKNFRSSVPGRPNMYLLL